MQVPWLLRAHRVWAKWDGRRAWQVYHAGQHVDLKHARNHVSASKIHQGCESSSKVYAAHACVGGTGAAGGGVRALWLMAMNSVPTLRSKFATRAVSAATTPWSMLDAALDAPSPRCEANSDVE